MLFINKSFTHNLYKMNNSSFNINQNDYNRFLNERLREDITFNNINNNKYITDDTTDEEEYITLNNINNNKYTIDDLSDDEEDLSKERKEDMILDTKKEQKDISSVYIKTYSIMICSLDRNLDDHLQSRYHFNVKFDSTGGSFSKKVSIYENSSTFLQTQLQRDKGLNGYPRDIDRVIKYLISNKNTGLLNIRNELKNQVGRMKYNPNEPEGEFVGYNIIYEHGNNSVTIPRRFLNIKSIIINRVIIPNRIYTHPYIRSLYGNPHSLFPYIYLNIPELQNNNYGSSGFFKNAFCILIPDRKEISELQYNPYGYTSYIPIDNNAFIYNPPFNGLNNITIDIKFPNNNSLIPSTYKINDFINTNNIEKIPIPYSDVVEVLQINIIKKKLEYSDSTLKPHGFLNKNNIHDNSQKIPFNKKEIYCFAIITNEYFKKEMFNVGSMIKLINYDGKLNSLYQFENDIQNPLNIDYYIPNLFKLDTEESKLIWTNNEIRSEAYSLLINSINSLLGKIKFNLNDNDGNSVIETGYINRDITELISREQLLVDNIDLNNFNANLLNNCYQYFNSFLYLKYLALPEENKPYCNVAGSNSFTNPACPDIDKPTNYLYGMCRQITNDVFEDNDGPFSYNREGFYNGNQDKHKPQEIPIIGSQLYGDVNSVYNQEIFTFLTPSFGAKKYYCEVEGIRHIKDNSKLKKCYQIKRHNTNSKNIIIENTNYELNNLINIVKKIYRNLEYLFKICDYTQDLEIIKFSIEHLLNINLYQSIQEFNMEIEECYNSLEIFHETLNISITLDDIDEHIINNIEQIQTILKDDNKIKINKTKYWFTIYTSIFKLFEIFVFTNRLINNTTHINDNLIENIKQFMNYVKHNYFNHDHNDKIEKDKIKCDNLCFYYSNMEIENETNNEISSCLSGPNVEIANIEGEYSEIQNQNCNGMLQNEEGEFINEKKLCKGCGQYIKGSNSNGLCNVILIPVPDILDIKTGQYHPLGLGYKVKEQLQLSTNLGYNPTDLSVFQETIYTIAFHIIKQILFNGGPLSLQIAKEKKCKIVSITEQINISMNINTEEPNINKILS